MRASVPALDFIMFNCKTRRLFSNIERRSNLPGSDTVGRRLGVHRCSRDIALVLLEGIVDVREGRRSDRTAVFLCTTRPDARTVGSGNISSA